MFDSVGTWAVFDYDEKPLPERWTTEDDAVEYGLAGKYLLSGLYVAQIDGSASASEATSG